jgi:hypothetical protein
MDTIERLKRLKRLKKELIGCNANIHGLYFNNLFMELLDILMADTKKDCEESKNESEVICEAMQNGECKNVDCLAAKKHTFDGGVCTCRYCRIIDRSVPCVPYIGLFDNDKKEIRKVDPGRGYRLVDKKKDPFYPFAEYYCNGKWKRTTNIFLGEYDVDGVYRIPISRDTSIAHCDNDEL